ncbi:hypothetical protein [Acetobacter sp. DsW_063]|uniref:hypothetical protein n=1 Tax=Acetobacter sp. DsW_063 TaxID=1514894 RepID=UPI000A3C8390|nr:hypothetical protein [Acetobacter sp. DsW_063]OUJ14168.1 hypothetical protein HK28_00710 [Acetobacter sp. DsW_063]
MTCYRFRGQQAVAPPLAPKLGSTAFHHVVQTITHANIRASSLRPTKDPTHAETAAWAAEP